MPRAADTASSADLLARVAELERERELLNAIANYAPSLICLIDPDGTVRPHATNRAFESTLGYEPENTGGIVFWERYVPAEDADEVRAAIERVVGGVPMEARDGRWLARDGRTVHVLWSCISLPMIESGPLWLISAADISDRKEHEEEVRRSRARIVAAADDARRRLERNLHDGAQQRLMSVLLFLRLGRSKTEDVEAVDVFDRAIDELSEAVKELRELARGIHPEALTRRGLAAALRQAAQRMPLPVELDVPANRFPEHVEAAVYYVVSESLANIAKYAGADSASVRVTPYANGLVVEIADDGAGGADPSAGTGLRGLADRMAALDGTLVVDSPPGRGTCVRAEVPLR